MNAELKNLLSDAANEIRNLRRINEVLTAKVEVMELFTCVLHTKAATRMQGESVDVAWMRDKAASETEAKV